MEKEYIIKAVKKIKEISGDDEMAHDEEDSLRDEFIEYVSTRKDALGEKARLVLSTNKIDFERWCV